MKTIIKGSEPSSLTQYRNTPGANYEDLPRDSKNELRAALSSEQGAICCYCMGRIYPKRCGMRVEHWRCQSENQELQLVYSNLLGACLGNEAKPNERKPFKELYCDARKGESNLSLNPANPEHQVEAWVRYHSNGRIESPDAKFNCELNQVLNLNHRFLVTSRKMVLAGFTTGLKKRGALRKDTIQRLIGDWDCTNISQCRPYCGVVVAWLRKRLARA
ncbi:MAG: TIGR02646 family protein [Gemmatimonadota bacterium]|nr:TIGR02646 family protein [Gemmatimonadota bacterium]